MYQNWGQLHQAIRHDIFQIRSYLTQKATESLVHSFITSRLDLQNGLLYLLPKKLVAKLQKIQNAAARAVLNSYRYASSKTLTQTTALASSSTKNKLQNPVNNI